jgi:hypothetical protein
MPLTQDIKDFALDLGHCKVGIATAEGFFECTAELESRREMYFFYVGDFRQSLSA